MLVWLVVACGVGLGATVLATAVHDVWQRSGGIVACLAAAAVTTSVFSVAPLAWLRVTRLLAGAVLTVGGTLLTLMLGFAVEHPAQDDPFLGGLMAATLLAFGATLATDVRIHVLEGRAAKELERRAIERHHAVLAALLAQDQAAATGRQARPGAAVLLAVGVGMLFGRVVGGRRL